MRHLVFGDMFKAPLARSAGFTIIELMMTLAVLALVAAFSIPAMQNVRASADLRSATSSLVAAMNIARSQAVSLRMDVDVEARGGDWANGWDVIYRYPATTPAGARVMQDERFPLVGTVAVTEAGGAVAVRFLASGLIAGGGASFELCSNSKSRLVTVSPLGRVSNEEGAC
ncbi:MAG: GspH/FimT family pseudopilin [Alcanivoracaceae bacterium]